MNIILSIHPKWANLIYEGKKTIEWRKNIPLSQTETVYLYETAPVCKVTGFFKYYAYTRVSKTHLELNKDLLTEKSCVPIEDIRKYFGKSEKIFGWLCNAGPRRNQFANPVPLSEFGIKRPPQSWCYTKVTCNAKTEQDKLDKWVDSLNKITREQKPSRREDIHGT